MQVVESSRRRISSGKLAWLEQESAGWRESGIVDEGARRLILERYTAESAERRGTIAMILVAISMLSVGLLLLIGYNWDQIPRAAKLVLVIGALAAAFGASAVAYAREKPLAAEGLAFFGTLLLGNAIWLVSQTLHIEGRYPDAFLWWTAGALASAWLVRSKWIGAQAAGLLFVWVALEGELSGRPAMPFLLLWPLTVAIAYSLGAPLMIRVAGPVVALWLFMGGMDTDHSATWLGSIALGGCALYGVGRWHRSDDVMRRAWEASGVIVLLLVFIPLMFTEIHKEMRPHGADLTLAVCAIVAGLVALMASIRPARVVADNGVLAVAAATAAWILASWSGVLGSSPGFALSATVLFSVLALVLCVSFIRSALVTSRIPDLAAGVLFALVFLVVRWTSVVENLLWSGLLLLSAGAGLLLLARLWRSRPRTASAAGRAS